MTRPMFFYAEDAGAGAGGGTAGAGGGSAASGTLLSNTGAGAGAGGGAGITAPPAWIKDDGSFGEKWIEKLPEDLRSNPSLLTVKSLPDLAKNYIATKGLVGKRLEMPGENATPEQVAEFRKVTGTPEKPEGYLGTAKSLRPEAVPEEAWDGEGEKKFLALAHKHHLSPTAVKEILAFHGEQVTGQVKIFEEAESNFLKAEGVKLREAWGKDFDNNVQLAARVAQTVGLDPKTHGVFKSAEMVQVFAKIGKLMSEDKLVRGEQSGSMAATIADRIRDIQDPKSSSSLARDYRGESGQERQKAAQDLLHQLMDSQSQKAA